MDCMSPGISSDIKDRPLTTSCKPSHNTSTSLKGDACTPVNELDRLASRKIVLAFAY